MSYLVRTRAALVVALSLFIVSFVSAEPIRVGVLKFGTVNWALSAMVDQGHAEQHGVELEIVPLANKNATVVAIQGGAVDMIVTDWIWVSRQRAEGEHFTFVPYSMAVGSVMVQSDGGIDSVADLAGKRLGVAGGPVDKSWLLLRAYSQKELGYDITEKTSPNFGAPPLLNELALNGELDAVLNFWHFAARLKAAGLKEVISVADMLPALGVDAEVPLLGWVFTDEWAANNPSMVKSFLDAASDTAAQMNSDDALWTGYLAPKTKAESESTLMALRDGYRAGIPTSFGSSEIEASRRVFEILAELGGEDLVGKSTTLTDGTFWPGYSF